ncbi:MAG TPA: efflux transporter outer membrane subunit [Gemmatimonadales bacterium]|jgi:multidrug efflux system outer membrane protein
MNLAIQHLTRSVAKHGSGALGALTILAAGGCAIGPRHTIPEIVPETAQVGAAPAPQATLFDSLARAAQIPAPVTPAAVFESQKIDAVAWLDVLRDTALVGLVRTALANNRDIRQALGRVDEYRAMVGTARSMLFPELDANASVSTNQIVIGASAPIPYDAIRATADLQWEIDFWGRIRKGITAAEADRDARTNDERALVLTVVSQVADGYLELLELREDLAVSNATLASRQATLGLARQRFTQGVISELDVRQFEADVASAASSVAQFTRSAAQQEHALSVLLGRAPTPVSAGGTLDSAVAAISVPDSIPSALLLRRPDVLSAERDLAAATTRVGQTISSILPRVIITGEYGRQSPSTTDVFGSEHEIYTLQAGVSMPIFAGGRQKSELDAARARVTQARAAYEKAVLTALGEAADALVAVRTEHDQLAADAAQTSALRDAYRLAERRYEGGISSYLEVLDAQRSLFTAELTLTQTRRLYLEATVQLYKALGGKWAATP